MINSVDDFFLVDDFAETAKVNNKSMLVIFDRVTTNYSDGYTTVSTHTPQITCKTVDVQKANAEQGSAVIVRSKNYTIADMEDDGTGISVLRLQEV